LVGPVSAAELNVQCICGGNNAWEVIVLYNPWMVSLCYYDSKRILLLEGDAVGHDAWATFHGCW
jgi:hypothetical protein